MPALFSQHDRRFDPLLLCQHRFSLNKYLAADLLTQSIFSIQLFGNHICFSSIVSNQKLYCRLSVLQTAYSVQPRRQNKADVLSRNILLRTATMFNKLL